MNRQIIKRIIQKTKTVPSTPTQALNRGNMDNPCSTVRSEPVARQLDVTLMYIGFKLSGELFRNIATSTREDAITHSRLILSAVKDLVDADKKHNVCHIDFPKDVPDCYDYWTGAIVMWFFTGECAYGKYTHTYEDMVKSHDEFMPIFERKAQVLHLGEEYKVYVEKHLQGLMLSNIPLSDSDKGFIKELITEVATWNKQVVPTNLKIPMRENKVFLNSFLINNKLPIIADTITDVLRLACELSGGDSSLETNTKFKIRSCFRKPLVCSLEKILQSNPSIIQDVTPYINKWKRLAHNMHMGALVKNDNTCCSVLFHIVHNNNIKKPQNIMSKFNGYMNSGDVVTACELLGTAPGFLIRCADRILSQADCHDDAVASFYKGLSTNIEKISGRVLLSFYEHLQNRYFSNGLSRIFINKAKKSYVTPDNRNKIPVTTCLVISELIEEELKKRTKKYSHVIVDKDVLHVAVPLSEKYMSDGFSVLPRGSVQFIDENADTVRVFCHWVQKEQRTDYDLSLHLLDENFESCGHVSWTRYNSDNGFTYSGDITQAPAPHGGFETIDVCLPKIDKQISYIIPQVFKFCGEEFNNIPISTIGYTEQHSDEGGKPFEPQTVKTKTELRGTGSHGCPFVLYKHPTGKWCIQWVHLFFNGGVDFNKIEDNKKTNSLVMASMLKRNYLTIGKMVRGMFPESIRHVKDNDKPSMDIKEGDSILYIGLQKPEYLSGYDNVTIITPDKFKELIPN